jgi:hypothetical protein
MNFSFLQRDVPKWQVTAAIVAVLVGLTGVVCLPALRRTSRVRAPGKAVAMSADTVPVFSVQAAQPPPRSGFDLRPSSSDSVSEPIPLPSGLARPATAEPMIIRSATVKLTVKDAPTALHELSRAATDAGGYIADSRIWRDQDLLRAHLTVRVPARSFDQTLAQTRRVAKRVDQEQVSGQDVTEEFTDLKAQLTNLEVTESELRQLLSAVRQRSQKASEVLAIYRELVTVRGQIERIQGRVQYLGNRVSFATLDVELVPEVLAPAAVEPAWKPLASAHNALATLADALKWLAEIITWLIVLVLPLVVLVLVPLRLILWLFRQRRNRAIGSAG